MARRRKAWAAALPIAAAPLLLGATMPGATMAGASGPGASGRTTSLEARLLAAHNRERAEAGLPAMQWDAALAGEAAGWAGRLAAADTLEHDEGAQDGENLWLGTRGAYTPEQMVGLWAAEKAHYRPGPIPAVSDTGDFEDVGHYTQLMWRETDRVGCALAAGRRDEVLVCRYRQLGNVEGERAF
ncbi:MAG: CAP domain-containing protein [Allosphingosinicella sp.]